MTYASLCPKDDLFPIGRGTKKVLCKMTKQNLTRSRAKSGEKVKESSAKKHGERADSLTSTTSLLKRSIDSSTEQRNKEGLTLTRHEIFSRYNQGIRVAPEDWQEVTPEFLAEHIARQFSGLFVIDGLCGSGGSAIQVILLLPLSHTIL